MNVADRLRQTADRLRGRRARCRHLDQIRDVTPGSVGCEGCLAQGRRWVHLRMCLTCGQVGCCMSSEGKHSLAHFDETGHPLVRSLEAGEDWRYCFAEWMELDRE